MYMYMYYIQCTLTTCTCTYTSVSIDLYASFHHQARFLAAMELVGEEFVEITEYFRKSWLPARNIVQQAVASRHEVQYTVRYVIYCVYM